VKISTIYKKHCRCWVRFTIEDVWFVYEYIFYTVREDQVKCNFLFGRREVCDVWSSYEKKLCQTINKLMDGFERKGGMKVGNRGASSVVTDDSEIFGL
jgi:hypothetical protein